MLARLSAAARAALLRFLSYWQTPAPRAPALPADIAAAMRDVFDAEARNDCRALGEARQRLRQLRKEGLLREAIARGYQPEVRTK